MVHLFGNQNVFAKIVSEKSPECFRKIEDGAKMGHFIRMSVFEQIENSANMGHDGSQKNKDGGKMGPDGSKLCHDEIQHDQDKAKMQQNGTILAKMDHD